MKSFSWLCLLLSAGQSIASAIPEAAAIQARASKPPPKPAPKKLPARAGTIAITGARGGVNAQTGERPMRRDINDMVTSGPAWDLYIQALWSWMQTDQTQAASYYQVSGIHGLPNIPWDGVQGGGSAIGYCTHASILFTSWHRPYIALFEQVIWDFAGRIAASYPDNQRAQYVAAANTLRLPYWDWTLHAAMPDIVNQPGVTINTAQGQKTIVNPLYRYKFHPYNGNDLGGYFANVNWTVRNPDSSTVSQPGQANSNLQQNANQFHDGTYQLWASQPDYAHMSNTAADPPNSVGYQNLENLHNIIHGTIAGDMGNPYIAAFDPIFFLHHENVDRIFAIWQALHPDSWVTPQANAQGTFTNKVNAVENAQTPLTPFHSDTAGTLFTSDTARYTRTFGYTYPEVVDWNVSSAQLSANVRTTINKVYNPSGSLKRRYENGTKPDANSAAYQWALNVRADRTLIKEATIVNFHFSGSPNDIIGSHFIPMMPQGVPGGTTTSGQLPLTHAVLPQVPDLGAEATLALLEANLSWSSKCVNKGDTPTNQIPAGSIKVQLVGRQVQQTGPLDEFPIYSPWKIWAEGMLGDKGSRVL